MVSEPLTPERFLQLQFPIHSQHSGPVPEALKDDTYLDLVIPRFSMDFFSMSFLLFLEGLRSRRFQTFDTDVDNTLKAVSIEDKYCKPVAQLADRLFFIGADAPSCSFSVDASNPHWRIVTVTATSVLQPNGSTSEKVLGVAIFVAPGILDPEGFPYCPDPTAEKKAVARRLLAELRFQCARKGCVYGLLTDEITSVFYEEELVHTLRDYVRFKVVSREEMASPRMALAFLIWIGATELALIHFSGQRPLRLCLGAMRSPSKSALSADALFARRSFEDFDLYTMQRSVKELKRLVRWKRKFASEAVSAPLIEGSTLKVCGTFAPPHPILRAHHPRLDLPPETYAIVTQHRRPRSTVLDGISLQDRGFEITKAVRTGPDHWSQIFFGRVSGCDEEICLKLFDDRLFLFPDTTTYSISPPERRLLSFHRPSDMMRHEEHCYDRLSHLQGSLVPHCYGFYEFEHPNGWRSWGFFTEIIDGPMFLDLPLSTYSAEEKTLLMSRLRHSLRALKYAGVAQGDWHLNQIMCPFRGSGAQVPDIVLIDFAFTHIYLDDDNGVYLSPDCATVGRLLYEHPDFDKETVEALWWPANEYEF
ncbi:hypothetical protein PLICRDRAFT_37942 [Plicaturopsis crispa FD-325 SS-3]|nr:hypothetical protein PLICRDRAFT_37942 [Plicaturopsis crispa FD-325 SS-3]